MNKIIKIMRVLILGVFALCFLFLFKTVSINAKSEATLTKKTYKITVGEIVNIEIENVPEGASIKYKPSKKGYVEVSGEGEVTALKKGTCKIKITVKTGKKTTKLKVKIKIKEASVKQESGKTWNTVEFGQYEQDNNRENGPEPIEWYVLYTDDEKSLLMSRYALDAMMYLDYDDDKLEEMFPGGSFGDIAWEEIDFVWENSILRNWLNGEFYKSVFSKAERKKIISVGDDKVSVLSLEDIINTDYGFASELYTEDMNRRCYPTEYAKSKGIETSIPYGAEDSEPSCWWWLKKSNSGLLNAAGVTESGSIDPNGLDQADDTIGVRPIIWVTNK